jgi:hypothetical protein
MTIQFSALHNWITVHWKSMSHIVVIAPLLSFMLIFFKSYAINENKWLYIVTFENMNTHLFVLTYSRAHHWWVHRHGLVPIFSIIGSNSLSFMICFSLEPALVWLKQDILSACFLLLLSNMLRSKENKIWFQKHALNWHAHACQQGYILWR